MEIAGGCLCGGTRYVLKVGPSSRVDWHCHDCRRSCGAPCVTWGSVRRADLIIGGREPRKVAHAGRIRSFAACCGTHLFFEESSDSETIDVTIASLDDPAPFAPQKAIWLEDKLPRGGNRCPLSRGARRKEKGARFKGYKVKKLKRQS